MPSACTHVPRARLRNHPGTYHNTPYTCSYRTPGPLPARACSPAASPSLITPAVSPLHRPLRPRVPARWFLCPPAAQLRLWLRLCRLLHAVTVPAPAVAGAAPACSMNSADKHTSISKGMKPAFVACSCPHPKPACELRAVLQRAQLSTTTLPSHAALASTVLRSKQTMVACVW